MTQTVCDRRGCEEQATHCITKDSVYRHGDPTDFNVCDEHAEVAVEEFRATNANILAGRRLEVDR